MEKMELHAGLIDGRNIKLEDKEEVKRKLCDLRKQMNPKKILLTTSCGLEFIPRNYAIEKMKRLKEIASSMSE
jgi:methionine synthase II (cobalamin-independent)